MRIMNNISAMNAHRLYTANNSKLSKSLEKLSSGYAINRAGDNAAGLAVSEKMRAQIAGLEQASKNAQDGISMVQTYEGALTESDSILQRMRSLAVQSANGTYDNSVDRVAIEQEFKQLNDELNQIADTDFNGVVVLNGGIMADGLEATAKGVFDYSKVQVREAAQLGSKEINTVDTKNYDAAAADDLWKNLGLTSSTDSVDITFTYNKTNDTWSVTGTSGDATTLTNAQAMTISKGSSTTKNNGGFALTTVAGASKSTDPKLTTAATGGEEIANVVLDSTQLVDGDTVTLTFTRPTTQNTAPENIGIIDNSLVITDGAKTTAGSITGPTAITVNPGAGAAGFETTNDTTKTKDMTADARDAFNGLNGATFEAKYTAAAEGTTAALNELKMTLADGKELNLTGISAADKTGTIISEDGISYGIEVTTAGVVTIKDNEGNSLAQITLDAAAEAPTTNKYAAGDNAGTVKFGIALDTAVYNEETEPDVTIKEPVFEEGVSKSNANNAATAKLTYSDGMKLQVGSRTKDLVDFTFQYDADSIGSLKADLDCSARGLGTDKLSLATQEDANAAIDKIDHAINKVSMVRGTFGAIQNRLEHKISNLDVNNENLTAAESRIRDTDMAAEMMEFTKNQILSQASQSMLAQANQLPQGVLSLLQ